MTRRIDALEEGGGGLIVEIKMADVFDKILVNDDLDTVLEKQMIYFFFFF
ncbi:MAG: hypothetical protein IPQ19_17440 [Bacteroidetes bacterium]|nr:hypothetical protein [Bacteroidota bacterium]